MWEWILSSICKMRSFAILFIALVAALSVLGAPAEEPFRPSLHPRIVGGENATPGAFPYQVSVWWGVPPLLRMRHVCGGSILNREWVLTAAYCLTELPGIGQFEVYAGKYNLAITESTQQRSLVENSYFHLEYTGGIAPNDIALLKMSTPFNLNDAVSSVVLPQENILHTGNALLSGWGTTSTTSMFNMTSILQSATLPIVPYEECVSALSEFVDNPPIAFTNICTGSPTGEISICGGDFGGPLVQYNSANQPELVGIVSWGISPCGTRGAPSVYVRVSAYLPWISQILEIG